MFCRGRGRCRATATTEKTGYSSAERVSDLVKAKRLVSSIHRDVPATPLIYIQHFRLQHQRRLRPFGQTYRAAEEQQQGRVLVGRVLGHGQEDEQRGRVQRSSQDESECAGRDGKERQNDVDEPFLEVSQ